MKSPPWKKIRRTTWLIGRFIPLALFLAAALLWVRSKYKTDYWSITTHHEIATYSNIFRISAQSTNGTLEIICERGQTPDPDAAAGTRFYLHTSSDIRQTLMFHAIPHNSILEKLGFRWVGGPRHFVSGYLATSAYETIIDLPTASLLLLPGLLVLFQGFWLWRKKRRAAAVVAAVPAIQGI